MNTTIQQFQSHSEYQAELAQLSASELHEHFSQLVPFGTGGMRGVMGAGLNRINRHTIRLAAYGVAQMLHQQGPQACAQGVVIAYDTRMMSQEFAYETAGVLAAHQIRVHFLNESRPTPLLSFAVRHLQAAAGVVITASHNPRQYNGFKVYGEDGAQLTPTNMEFIRQTMEEVDDIFAIKALSQEQLEQTSLFTTHLTDLDEAYEQAVIEAFSSKTHSVLKATLPIVYTPLHGAGLHNVSSVLQKSGFQQLHIVEEQTTQNGQFATVSAPNPEEKEAFDQAIQLGQSTSAKLLLATDPDADRLGVAVLHDNQYRLLTGNEVGALTLHYLLSTRQFPPNAAAVKTIVTSDLGEVIAQHYNIKIHNTLTGFKYIAEKIEEWSLTGEHTFLFGYEESYGYLAGDFVRDKDAVQMALLVAEMATHYAANKKTLVDALYQLYDQFGHYRAKLVSKTFESDAMSQKMDTLMQEIRANGIEEIDGVPVSHMEDYLTESINGLPLENVLKLYLENGSWLCIRPSGTEPKCKFYMSAVAEDAKKAENNLESLARFVNDLIN